MNALLGGAYLGATLAILAFPFTNRIAWALEQRRYYRRKK